MTTRKVINLLEYENNTDFWSTIRPFRNLNYSRSILADLSSNGAAVQRAITTWDDK